MHKISQEYGNSIKEKSSRRGGGFAHSACLLWFILFTGCSGSSSSAPEPAAPTPPSPGTGDATPTNPPSATPTPAVKLPTDPIAIYAMIDTAVRSVFSTLDGHDAPSFAPASLALATSLTASAECTDTATPKNVLSGVPFPPVHKDFAAGRIYCLIADNTQTANSLQGTYALTRGVLCLIQKSLQGSFSGKVAAVPVDFADTACFDDEFRNARFPDSLPAAAIAQVTATRPSVIAPDKWDSSIVATIPAEWGGGGTLTILVATKGALVAAATLYDHGGGKSESASLALDTAAGVLRADGRVYHWSDGDETRNGHFRVRVAGKVGTDGAFSALTGIEGVDSLAFNMDPDKEIRLYSLKADFAQGARAMQRACDTASGCTDVFDITKYAASQANKACYPGDSGADGCTGVTPIGFDGATDVDFALIPGGPRLAGGDALVKAGPLGFNAVSTEDVEP